jgi:antitoxin component of MazEF toxin-antitoxin module
MFYRRIMVNSRGYHKIAIPRPIMEGLGLITGESLQIERIEDKIVMTPVVQTRPREGTTGRNNHL